MTSYIISVHPCTVYLVMLSYYIGVGIQLIMWNSTSILLLFYVENEFRY